MSENEEGKETGSIDEKLDQVLNEIDSFAEKIFDRLSHPSIISDIHALKLCMLEAKNLMHYLTPELEKDVKLTLETTCSMISHVGKLREKLDNAVMNMLSKVGNKDRTLAQWVTDMKIDSGNLLDGILSHAIETLKTFAKESGVSSYSLSIGYYELYATLNFNIA